MADPAGSAPSFAAVDTHCHLFLMDEDPGHVIADARAVGVPRLVCVGIDPQTSRRALQLAQSFRGVFATAGMHPHTASALDRRGESEVEELLADPMVVAVGETGLDAYRRLSPMEDQDRAFRTHVALSRETGKPVVVHVRDAWEDAFRILEEERAEHVVLHCFTGDRALGREAAERGYFLSFAGNVTYPSASALREAASEAPLDRLLAETDSPFLTPQVRRGTPNHPANLVHTLAVLADIRGLDLDEMVAHTAENAHRAFPLVR